MTNKLRILVLSQYFWPENFIINDIVRVLDEQGHEVAVATGKPNYPQGRVFPGYAAGGVMRECYLGRIPVTRVPLWPRGAGGALNLALNYASFALSGLLLPWLLRGRRFDAILVFAPSPITQTIPAIVLKYVKGARLSLWIQDLWPESLSATGFVRNRWLLALVGVMVRAIYAGCDSLLVQSRAFIEPVAQRADRRKIRYYPNSMDNRTPVSAERIPDALAALLEAHFCVVFAGNLGTAQGLDTLVGAAAALRVESRIRLVLVGHGSRFEWLEERKQALGLDNLILTGAFPREAVGQIFERASALLVSLTDEPVFALTIPSKVQAYLAAGRPILASLNGEGARVVGEAGAGLASSAGDVDGLVRNIRRLAAADPGERAAMGDAGRAYFDAHFDMVHQVEVLIGLLRGGMEKQAEGSS